MTKLSALIMGLGCAAHRQIIKGLMLFACEIAYIAFMITKGAAVLALCRTWQQ
jgi:arabinogalactan oligomer/maltooligosaccharide transport system permease protein